MKFVFFFLSFHPRVVSLVEVNVLTCEQKKTDTACFGIQLRVHILPGDHLFPSYVKMMWISSGLQDLLFFCLQVKLVRP